MQGLQLPQKVSSEKDKQRYTRNKIDVYRSRKDASNNDLAVLECGNTEITQNQKDSMRMLKMG